MEAMISLFITTALMGNIMLTQFMGVSIMKDATKKSSDVLYIGILTLITTFFTTIISYFIYNQILVSEKLEYLSLLIFTLITIMIAGVFILIFKKNVKFKNGFPFIVCNSAILFTTILGATSGYTVTEMLIYALAAPLGFVIALYILATIKERLDASMVPKPFQGMPIMLIVAGTMSLVISTGLAGLVG